MLPVGTAPYSKRQVFYKELPCPRGRKLVWKVSLAHRWGWRWEVRPSLPGNYHGNRELDSSKHSLTETLVVSATFSSWPGATASSPICVFSSIFASDPIAVPEWSELDAWHRFCQRCNQELALCRRDKWDDANVALLGETIEFCQQKHKHSPVDVFFRVLCFLSPDLIPDSPGRDLLTQVLRNFGPVLGEVFREIARIRDSLWTRRQLHLQLEGALEQLLRVFQSENEDRERSGVHLAFCFLSLSVLKGSAHMDRQVFLTRPEIKCRLEAAIECREFADLLDPSEDRYLEDVIPLFVVGCRNLHALELLLRRLSSVCKCSLGSPPSKCPPQTPAEPCHMEVRTRSKTQAQ